MATGSVTHFKQRLKREGRYEAYLVRLEELKSTDPRRDGTPVTEMTAAREAARIARQEFGYLGNREYMETKEYKDTVYMDVTARKQRDAQKKHQTAKKEKTWESALSELPHTCDPAKEMDWVAAHPAMMRHARGEVNEENGKVLLTAKDITSTCVGPAPSKRAVCQLQTWCNLPEDFYKAITSEHKKAQQSVETADGTEAPDEDLNDVRRMLASIESRVQDAETNE